MPVTWRLCWEIQRQRRVTAQIEPVRHAVIRHRPDRRITQQHLPPGFCRRVALHHRGDIRAKIVKHLNRPPRQKKPRRLFIRDGEAAIPLCLSPSKKIRSTRFALTRRPCQSLSCRLSPEARGCTSLCALRGALSAGGAPSLSLPAQVLFRSSPLRLIICGASGEVKLFRAPNRPKTDCRQFSCVSPFADA